MRTTVDLADDLFRRAKAEAALRGKRFKDLVEEGLFLVLGGPGPEPSARRKPTTVRDLMAARIGMVDTGIPDLASNPKHLKDLGRDSLGDR
jgi:hypothetical protein